MKVHGAMEAVGGAEAWRGLSIEELRGRFIDPLARMNNARFARIIQDLTDETFDNWTRALWTAQDGEYTETLDMVRLLRRTLLARLPVVPADRRQHLQRQLAFATIIVHPELFDK